MAAHRYWRIYITGTVHLSHVDLREIELRESIGGADATGTGTASASAESGGFEASKAFDNNSGTTWYFPRGSNPLPQWIKYDFGSGNAKDIVEISLTPWQANECIFDFQLQYSDDNTNWTTLYTRESEAGWVSGTAKVINSSNTLTQNGAGSAWRVNATSVSDGGTRLGVTEMEFRGSIGGADLTGSGAAFASSVDQGISNPNPAVCFDDTSAEWASDGVSLPDYVGYRFAGPTDVAQVTIKARTLTPSGQAPANFTIEKWNGSAWVVMLTVTGSTGWTSGETRTFNLATPAVVRPVVCVCC